MPSPQQISLLALCSIKRLSWYLIAREAMRPGGLESLLEGHLTERSPEATKARNRLLDELEGLDELRAAAVERIAPALKMGAKLTTVLDPDYPLNLRTIFNCPPFLFYRGHLRQDDVCSVAVVGTRKASSEGLRRAAKMARLLSAEKVTVLSGLAQGIDTAAHRAALDVGGRTIAVVGTGLLTVFPPENALMAEEIADTGAVVSQFWPDTPPARFTFPRRNITMSGMGQGTVVIEAGKTSGAKLQARYALEHGKKVFLLESLVRDQSWARSYLQRPGARQVAGVEEIISELRSPAEVRTNSRLTEQLGLQLS